MVIQHNLSAMNAGRYVQKNRDSLKKNLEKLSSGYRINRSADDAAGLAISEKMRASISALEQAENNVRDGIGLVQTADGAMQEIHDMLDRLTTLATQAANGTLIDVDREKIQKEVDQILNEITRIKNTTMFNEIPLLQGTEGTTNTAPVVVGGLPKWVSSTAQNNGLVAGTYQGDKSSVTLDFTNGFNKNDLLKKEVGFNTTCCTCNNHYSIKFTNESTSKTVKSGIHYITYVGIKDAQTAEDVVNKIIQATGGTPGSSTSPGTMGYGQTSHYTQLVTLDPGKLIVYDYRSGQAPNVANDRGTFTPGVAYAANEAPVGDVVLQIGDNTADQMDIKLANMSLTKIGISNLSVRTFADARAAIDKIATGVDYVSGERGRMGAYQNRLEHTTNHLGNTIENLTQSESTIRDTDVASEMMAYTKHNILLQSAQAMLAQANQVPRGVLQLMQ